MRRIGQISGEIGPTGGGRECCAKWAILIGISVRNAASIEIPDCPGFYRNFGGVAANPSVSENDAFPIANRG